MLGLLCNSQGYVTYCCICFRSWWTCHVWNVSVSFCGQKSGARDERWFSSERSHSQARKSNLFIRLTTLFSLCLFAPLCDFLDFCLTVVLSASLYVWLSIGYFSFFCPTDCPTDWLTVLLSLCATWYLSLFVLHQILNVLTVVKWHSLSLIISYLVSFRLLLKILIGCHLLMHSKFILWNDIFVPVFVPFTRASSCGALMRQTEAGNKFLWMTSSTLCDVIHLIKADITRLLDKRHSAQREAAESNSGRTNTHGL